MNPEKFVELVQTTLSPLGTTGEAIRMKAYQRDQFEFLGVRAPLRRSAISALQRENFEKHDLIKIVNLLWDLPQREYQYAAIDLLTSRHSQLDLDDLDYLLELADRKSWWESVDGITAIVGDVLRREKQAHAYAQKKMDTALLNRSMWIRRIAMTHQLGWRLETDSRRLFNYANVLGSEKNFFIRKAIGWALRDYAKWNPISVEAFIENYRATLSPLTCKEALRHYKYLRDASSEIRI